MNRARPKSNERNQQESIKKLIQRPKMKIEKSKAGIEWLAQNWRRYRISNIEASPYIALLTMYAEDHQFLPSVKEILEGLIVA